MLRAFPYRTFGEIAELGLEVSVYCSSCYRERGPIDLTDAPARATLCRRALRERLECLEKLSREIAPPSPPAAVSPSPD
jgi:hypothetical protein